MRAFWIVLAVVPITIVGGLAFGFLSGLIMWALIIGVLTAPIWIPLGLLVRWLVWKSPKYRARVFSRWWLNEKISEWNGDDTGPSWSRST